MLLSTVEEISIINDMKVTALSFIIFLFKYRWWTCKMTKDYIVVCIVVNACMYIYVYAYTPMLVSRQKETFKQM